MTRQVSTPLHRTRGLLERTRRRTLAGALRLFRLRESRERVARGFALGLIVNLLPTFGFGVLISGFVARVLGGNLMAGLAGGASLTFAWPLLFYLNMRMGQLFVSSPRVIDDFDDVTVESTRALVWGKAFLVGSIINCVVVGLVVYLVVLAAYAPARPIAVEWLRRRASSLRRRASGRA